MSTVTLNKSKIVAEDLEVGLGTVVQPRGIGSKINAGNIAYDDIQSIKDVLDSKLSSVQATIDLSTKADKYGNTSNVFSVAPAVDASHAVPLAQHQVDLSLKANLSDTAASLDLKADKAEVLTLNNSTPFDPVSPYQPATKKYVDDTVLATGAADMRRSVYDTNNSGVVDTTEGIGLASTFLGISPHDKVMRVGQTAITDCDTIPDMGIFIGTSVANSPVGGTLVVEQLINGTQKAQRAFASESLDTYFRSFDGNNWSAWRKAIDQGDLVNNLSGSLDPYAVLHAAQGKILDDKILLKADAATTVTKDSSTGAAQIPVGTKTQRPSTPSAGLLRFNDDIDKFEGYNGSAWG
ncbi:MAG: hypothetical protein JHC33_11380, partial [Ignisphaera sp.]|nr:hypothetical protein [Ignisphaera sp.]